MGVGVQPIGKQAELIRGNGALLNAIEEMSENSPPEAAHAVGLQAWDDAP